PALSCPDCGAVFRRRVVERSVTLPAGCHRSHPHEDMNAECERKTEMARWQNMTGQHGRDCPKVEHVAGGYLHTADDDRPYDVDGLMYCGRCHAWIATSRYGSE